MYEIGTRWKVNKGYPDEKVYKGLMCNTMNEKKRVLNLGCAIIKTGWMSLSDYMLFVIGYQKREQDRCNKGTF